MTNITYAIYPTTKIIGLISYDFYSTHINSLQFLPVSSWNLAKLFNKYSGNGSFGKRWQATENFATNSPVTKLIHFHPVSNVIPIVANMCQQLSIAKGPTTVWVQEDSAGMGDEQFRLVVTHMETACTFFAYREVNILSIPALLTQQPSYDMTFNKRNIYRYGQLCDC